MESSTDGQTDSDMDDPDTFKCGICLVTLIAKARVRLIMQPSLHSHRTPAVWGHLTSLSARALQDTIYLATALECGHRFCARCVIAIAIGHDGNRGDVDRLLASGPVGCSTVPCPQCRATEHGNSGKGVFFNAAR